MNESEDRPTPSDRPAPQGDPPDAPGQPQPAGGPPAEPLSTLGGPINLPAPPAPPAPPPAPRVERPAEPEATWEDVVDPAPPAAPEPPGNEWPEPNRVRTPPHAATRSSPVVPAGEDPIGDDGFDDYEDAPTSRWVSLLATLGTALIGIVTVQVLTSLVEGLTLKSGQRVGVPDDLLHRLGYPFGGLGATALVFLVLGIVLVSIPAVLDELLSESQERLVGVALIMAVIMGVIIAIGSLLAVRANLHEYAAKNVPVPSYVRVQFTNFLLGSLGAAALALFGSIASINERGRERL